METFIECYMEANGSRTGAAVETVGGRELDLCNGGESEWGS